MFLSIHDSTKVIRSFSYVVWFALCYLLYFSVVRAYVRSISADGILAVFKNLGRIQVFVCLVEKLLGIDRPSLLYYEPSYMAFALLPYIYFSLTQFKNNYKIFSKVDIAFVFLLVFLTMSANLLLAMTFVVLISYLRVSFKSFFLILILSVFGYFSTQWYYQNNYDLLAITFKKVHESPNVVTSLLERTGNRWPRTIIGIDVIYDYFPKGIGLGAFSDFSSHYNVSRDYTNGFPWNEPRGLPASNVFVEVLSEGGVFVFISLLFFWVNLFFAKPESNVDSAFINHWRKILFIFLLLLMFESSLLRPYFWVFMGIISGLLSSKTKKSIRVN